MTLGELLTSAEQTTATSGTRGVRLEPLVDAFDMESMVALGQDPHRFFINKF